MKTDSLSWSLLDEKQVEATRFLTFSRLLSLIKSSARAPSNTFGNFLVHACSCRYVTPAEYAHHTLYKYPEKVHGDNRSGAIS